MMKIKNALVVVVSCLALSGCVSSRAPVLTSDADLVHVGGARVDAATRTVVVTGFVNMAQGAIELLACGPGGKRHESAFVIETGAVDLQAALLLAGAKAGTPMLGPGMGPPEGTALDVWVQWKGPGGHLRQRAEYFVNNNNTGKPMGESRWLFTGSVVKDGYFKALAEESLLATYWDPWAIINLASPLGGDDEALSLNPARMPPPGTSITMLIKLQ